MSNSSLATYKRLSPNCSSRNGAKVDKVTVHHMAGVLTVEQCASIFANSSRQASSNYGIGNDGRVGLYVDESKRSWASSSYANDRRAVTIEVSNSSTGGDWPVSAAAWKSLVALVADICKRNGIARLNWTGNANGNLTCHYMFAATACPGPYLKARMGQLASEVNAKLGAGGSSAPSGGSSSGKLVVDGIWGSATTLKAQQVLGAPYKDGVISRQNPQHRGALKACTSGWEFAGTAGVEPGSQTVSLLQAKWGAAPDGFMGPATVNAMIRYYKKQSGATQLDGKLDYPSITVKAFQAALNAGRI